MMPVVLHSIHKVPGRAGNPQELVAHAASASMARAVIPELLIGVGSRRRSARYAVDSSRISGVILGRLFTFNPLNLRLALIQSHCSRIFSCRAIPAGMRNQPTPKMQSED